jgi:hypothetical protein
MAQFPLTPVPSHVSAPAFIDPMHVYATDSGVEIRRSKHSRPRRQYTVEWLGKSVADMRFIRDFVLNEARLGTLPFQWLHPTAIDRVNVFNTTPIILEYFHGMFTGQWVGVSGSPFPAANGFRSITRVSASQLALTGTTGGAGAGTALAQVYLPNAVARFDQDQWTSPTTLIGPEQLTADAGVFRSGFYSWSLVIQEVF